MKNRRRTRNYFPEPRFQFRFLRLLIFGAFVQLAITGGILYYFLHQNYELLVKYAGLDPTITQLLFAELKVMILLIGITFLGYLCAVTILGVLFSHRVAGPIYAMRRTIRDINSGKDIKMKFRVKDEFQDVAVEFNKMINTLKEGSGEQKRKAG